MIIFSIGQKIIENNQYEQREEALEMEIASIMDDYGLITYIVQHVDYSYEIFAEGFENLTNGEALSCLKELDGVSTDDPCGDGEIDFGVFAQVHPGLDVEYSYWRVSSWLASYRKNNGGNGTVPGIYCNQYGNECVYECEN